VADVEVDFVGDRMMLKLVR